MSALAELAAGDVRRARAAGWKVLHGACVTVTGRHVAAVEGYRRAVTPDADIPHSVRRSA